jgi:hypothetical protein
MRPRRQKSFGRSIVVLAVRSWFGFSILSPSPVRLCVDASRRRFFSLVSTHPLCVYFLHISCSLLPPNPTLPRSPAASATTALDSSSLRRCSKGPGKRAPSTRTPPPPRLRWQPPPLRTPDPSPLAHECSKRIYTCSAPAVVPPATLPLPPRCRSRLCGPGLYRVSHCRGCHRNAVDVGGGGAQGPHRLCPLPDFLASPLTCRKVCTRHPHPTPPSPLSIRQNLHPPPSQCACGPGGADPVGDRVGFEARSSATTSASTQCAAPR